MGQDISIIMMAGDAGNISFDVNGFIVNSVAQMREGGADDAFPGETMLFVCNNADGVVALIRVNAEHLDGGFCQSDSYRLVEMTIPPVSESANVLSELRRDADYAIWEMLEAEPPPIRQFLSR